MQDLIIRNSSRLEFTLRVTDLIALWCAGQFAGLLRFSAPLETSAPVHTILLYFCCALAFLLFSQLDLYSSWRGRSMLSMFGQLAASWAAVLLIGLFFSFLIHHVGSLSRLWLFYWYVTGIVSLIFSRSVVYSILNFMRRKGMNSKRVIIVGYGPIGQEMHRRADEQSWFGYDVKAVYPGSETPQPRLSSAVERIDSLPGIQEFVGRNHIHEIWITLPMSASAELQSLQYLLRNALVDIRWIPDTMSMQILSHKMIHFLGLPAVELNQPMSGGVHGIAKDLFDKLFAITALVLLAPLFIVLAIMIKLSSPGPVFFKQPRLGLNGKPFNVYKFRSMKIHQEHDKVTQATQDDPRVTKIGKFIRRTSLDELPQFINVLRGEMSVVGPRPHALQHNEMYKDKLEMYMLRHRVKPGITGWAQIHGYRGETDTVDKMAKRVEFDLHYIQNWSLWMDIKIIIWTAFKGWTGSNAY
ncbi:undecaprenyl-phosphate glucose phosphotransferase [Oxalobacteraceae bacterium R-40]|uniref:Undecaprenyl-phosphate glucose phosphotransferase n=1 Tax=Keguizhuia sedimenti TaxID=3064264 RepID=A0ABU1BNY5_9BURK|nr:undecaprenyl-phosphate glucose phosphotransferase [Oxalobacteraceae bacterium R-40]